MWKSLWVALVVIALLPRPLAVEAQGGKVPQVGLLLATSSSAATHPVEAFRQGLRDLGYTEGQTIVIRYRWAEGQQERMAALAQELAEMKVDVIVAAVSAAARAAKNATTTIPIVMLVAGDPVRLGLVSSLARPDGNVTGLTSVGDELYPKQVQLLKEAVPKASRLAVLWNPANPSHRPQLERIAAAARSLNMKPQLLTARSPDELGPAFAAMSRARADALLVMSDAMFVLHRARIAELVASARLPAVFGNWEHAEDGGLMAYAASFADLYRRGAGYVDRILKGARPADLPIAQPTKFELVLNLKTARTLGLTIPPSLQLRADRVIE